VKKVIIIIIIAAILLVAFLAAPYLSLLVPKAAYYVYKEITYKTVSDSIAANSEPPERVVILFNNFFHENLFSPIGAKAIDKDTYNDLVRGIGFCDQKAWGMSALLARRGIYSRMVMTTNPEGQSNHTVMEAKIGGRWCFFDPQYGFVVRKANGELASFNDVCEDPSLILKSQAMLDIKKFDPASYDVIKGFFGSNIFYPNAKKPTIWDCPDNNKSFFRFLLAKELDLYVKIFGKKFAYTFQDIYLNMFAGKSGYNELFFRARNYDIYGRHDLAVDYYVRFIKEFPLDPDQDDALIFLGLLYTRAGEAGKAIDVLDHLLEVSPSTMWGPRAYYYLGCNYESQAEIEKAKDCYKKSIEMLREQDGELAMVKLLELHSVSRLLELR